MNPEIRNYCRHIRRKQLEILRYDRRKGVWYWDLPACASVCHDGHFNRMKRGYSHPPIGTKWHNSLRIEIQRTLGNIGSRNVRCNNTIGNCAEQHSGNNYMNKYRENNISALFFTETVRPRTMEIIPACNNCSALFPNL